MPDGQGVLVCNRLCAGVLRPFGDCSCPRWICRRPQDMQIPPFRDETYLGKDGRKRLAGAGSGSILNHPPHIPNQQLPQQFQCA